MKIKEKNKVSQNFFEEDAHGVWMNFAGAAINGLCRNGTITDAKAIADMADLIANRMLEHYQKQFVKEVKK